MSSDRRYTQEEVDAILKRALSRDQRDAPDAMSHQDLLETAKEVGIEPAQVEAAVAEVKREQQAAALRDQWAARSRERFGRSLRAWALVNAICFAVNMLAGASVIWFPWVLVPWGTVLFMQYLSLRRAPSQNELRRLERRIEREERKRQLQARFERGADVLSAAVEEGANLLRAHLDERQRRLEAGRRDEPVNQLKR